MRRMLVSIVILFVSSTVVYGQTHNKDLTVEISGNVLYDYSNLTWGPYPGESFERFTRSHTITFSPSIGYFVTSELEFVLEPHYAYRFYELNYSEYQSGQPPRELVYSHWTHNIGVSGGPIYNHRTSEALMFFAGLQFGVSWTYFGLNPPSPRPGSPWKKPEINFPKIVGGAKIFFTDDWATVLLLQYSRTTNYNGYDDFTNTELALGLGLSVFL